jgi:4-hydroxythreonine-4-phosphate dehydrogenase
MIVVSTGCPSGVGPEVSVAAAAKLPSTTCILVGDEGTLRAAAERVGVAGRRLIAFRREGVGAARKPRGAIFFVASGPLLGARDRKPGRPTTVSGAAQLAYVDAAYDLVKATPGSALVSGPVSKAAIAHSGARGAARFRGHTEWLRDRDRAPVAIMCFASPRLVTSLVTTHLPLSRVPRAITKAGVRDSTVQLVRLLRALGKRRPRVAVTSLNPHAGESELLGREEATSIIPGIELARAEVGRGTRLVGPLGAETAYRLAYAGHYDGVVAMYHDQATIPMKLVAFGDAVNVTMGLSVVRTSVDHGTAYDIAWTGQADAGGMIAAIELANALVTARAR